MPEISGPQIPGANSIFFSKDQILHKQLSASYPTYRTMRKHPTIALARGLFIAPIITSPWTVEADDDASDAAIEFISEWAKNKTDLKYRIASSGCDYGWFGGEILYVITEDNLLNIEIKQLIPDLNSILIDENGNFQGFAQINNMYTTPNSKDIIPLDKAFICPFRVEGQYLYGASLLDNALDTFNSYVIAEESASKYDKKIAGAQYKIAYPEGKTIVSGETKHNSVAAKEMLNNLDSGKGITLPRCVADTSAGTLTKEELERYSWDVGILEDASPRQSHFVDRLRYLDSLLVRAMIMPERTTIEGQFGTKAESEAQADIAIKYSLYQSSIITDAVNKQIIDKLLAFNFGADQVGKVRLKDTPIIDDKISYLRTIYTKILDNPNAINSIDIDSLQDSIGIPKNEQVTEQINQTLDIGENTNE